MITYLDIKEILEKHETNKLIMELPLIPLLIIIDIIFIIFQPLFYILYRKVKDLEW